jgi:hypothetical protein
MTSLPDIHELDAIAQEIAAVIVAHLERWGLDLIVIREFPSRDRFLAILKTHGTDMVRALHRALHPVAVAYDFDDIDLSRDERDAPEDLVLLRHEHLLEPPR